MQLCCVTRLQQNLKADAPPYGSNKETEMVYLEVATLCTQCFVIASQPGHMQPCCTQPCATIFDIADYVHLAVDAYVLWSDKYLSMLFTTSGTCHMGLVAHLMQMLAWSHKLLFYLACTTI